MNPSLLKPASRVGAKRVLIVTYEYPPLGGGGGVIFRDLAEELAKRIEVTVLTSLRDGLPEHERKGNLEIARVPVWMRDANAVASLPSMLSFFPASLKRGNRLLRTKPYDLVHTSFAVPSGPSGLLLARRFRLPHVLSVHGGDIYDPSKRLSPHRTPLLHRTVSWVIQGSDRVVAQSTDTAERTTRIYGDRALDLIPLAVRPIPFEPLPRSALGLGLGADDLVLVTVGRLVARKGLDRLIEVLARFSNPRARLVIVGDGPDREKLAAQARGAGVGGQVLFTGFVSPERKWQLLAASDLYVSTTLHEGFGIVFLEAMESSLPVLCYDRGGQVDFLRSDFARLVPVGRDDLFLEELAKLLGDEALRRAMGKVAQSRAKDFTVERFASRYLELYEDCLASRHLETAV